MSLHSLIKLKLLVKVKSVTLQLTASQSVTPSGVLDQIFITLTVTVLFLWGALSDERTGLSFVYVAGPCQRSLSRVRVPWDSRPYFTVSDLILPFSSPPTTRRVTVEVFDPASTRVLWNCYICNWRYIAWPHRKQSLYCCKGLLSATLHSNLLARWLLPSNVL
jgi:hypothetical protein